MIRNEIYLAEYNWTVTLFAEACYKDTETILQELRRLGCTEKCPDLSKGNCGLTYSDIAAQRSVMVISKASSYSEAANTIAHESMHLVSHICECYNIDMNSERACYLIGELVQVICDNYKL